MQRAKYNVCRLGLYQNLFDAVLENRHCETIAANLLMDIRWMEVPRAFANCLCDASLRGPIRPLAEDFARLVSSAAQLAFGTTDHAELPSWFLQNHEGFLASCLHKLLMAFSQRATAPLQMHRAFAALIDVAEGLKAFLGLRHLASSTGAHALMSATANSRYDFLREKHCTASAAALCFAELLAERVLEESRDDEGEADSPLLYFARSKRWQAFAASCIDCFSSDEAFARLCRLAKAAVEAPKKEAPGLFFLASAFLDADARERVVEPASPEPLRKAAKAVVAARTTPVKACRSAIRKRSAPFVKLVQRLLATSQA